MLPSKIHALILDMDGVLWIEDHPIGNLPAIFDTLQNRALRCCLATNNSTRTPEKYLERLGKFGVTNLIPEQIVTSSQALSAVLSEEFPERGDVYAIGEDGLFGALCEQGFTVVNENNTERVIAVVVGMDREISFKKLRCATLLIRQGIPFYGTNPDRTFPTPVGLIPGAGSIIAALVASTDVQPIITGKPSPHMIRLALKRIRTSPQYTLVVGDRIDTDIAAGKAAGCKTALVLSGVTTKKTIKTHRPSPDLIVDNLETLIQQLPQ